MIPKTNRKTTRILKTDSVDLGDGYQYYTVLRHYINDDSHNDTGGAFCLTDSASSSKPPLDRVPHVTREHLGSLDNIVLEYADVSITKLKIHHFEPYQNRTNSELRDLSKKLDTGLEDLPNKTGNDTKDRDIESQALANDIHADLDRNVK
ncbi:hypothetical protein HOY80DRAFT_1002626 [Tuber brumale]|nr:hypothetical protein HOY80DRAFT_1002626 [Tuber brumale]